MPTRITALASAPSATMATVWVMPSLMVSAAVDRDTLGSGSSFRIRITAGGPAAILPAGVSSDDSLNASVTVVSRNSDMSPHAVSLMTAGPR